MIYRTEISSWKWVEFLRDVQHDRTIVIDIDGTVCEEGPVVGYADAKLVEGAVDVVNSLYDCGFKVFFYSSRHFLLYEVTCEWLKKHGFKYSGLILGKPVGAIYLDDKALRFDGDWQKTKQEIMDRLVNNE